MEQHTALNSRLVVERTPESVPAVRGYVISVLRRWGARAETVDDAALLVSELATNAVLHAHGHQMTVRLSALNGTVRCLVHDDSSDLPGCPRLPEKDEETGRGLYLVEALALRWGTGPTDETAPGRKAIWFEIADPAPPTTALLRRRPRAGGDATVRPATPVDPTLLHRVLLGLRRT